MHYIYVNTTFMHTETLLLVSALMGPYSGASDTLREPG